MLLTCGAALWGSSAAALAGPGDVAATRSYVQDNYELVRGTKARLGAAEAAIRGLIAKVRRECPRVGAGSPQDEQSEQLNNEVIGTIVVTAWHVGAQPIRAYLRKAGALRWSDPRLTRAVHSYVAKLGTITTLPAPDLCADVRAWAASGYRTLPAGVARFDRAYLNAWVAVGLIPRGLSPYETAAERAVIRRSRQLAEAIADFEARAVERYGELLDALEVQQ